MAARGIRNNNPGNIEFNKKVNWLGQTGVESEGRFATFESPAHGIRAIVITLRTYREKHGLLTVGQFIGRWAPASENNVEAYVKATGFPASHVVDFEKPEEVSQLIKAIIKHENGSQPYSDAVIAAGIGMARRKLPKPKPLAQSKTLQGGKVATVGGTGATATTALLDAVNQGQQNLQPLIEVSEVLRYVFLALVFVGIGITVYARIKQHNQQDIK